MQSIRQVQRLNEAELAKCVPPNASWHTDYRDTAYIYIGGLPFELSEGDVMTIFSQYGSPTHINLVRDKETGKSRGFCFLKYEDQRSCDLAVDNLSGATVMGRMLSVDHTRYKKKEGEVETVGQLDDEGDATDQEGAAGSKRRRIGSASESEEERPMIKEEMELAKLESSMDDHDPMKAYLVKEKQAEVEEALKAVVKAKDRERQRRHRHRHHHHRSRRGEGDGERDCSRWDRDDEDNRRRRSQTSRRKREGTPESEEEAERRRKHPSRRDEDGDESEGERRRRRRRERSASDRSGSRDRYRRR